MKTVQKNRFMYVFSKEDRDDLVAAGYTLIQNDEENKIFVFENKNNLTFDKKNVEHIETDTLTF